MATGGASHFKENILDGYAQRDFKNDIRRPGAVIIYSYLKLENSTQSFDRSLAQLK